MNVKIGKKIRQVAGFSAFILEPFPQKELFNVPPEIFLKAAEANRWIGKLDGITHILPDISFFLHMFLIKDAVASSQIEGTRATLIDVLEQKVNIPTKEKDADDIIYYMKALEHGIGRMKNFPLSLRLIREIHKELMLGARSTHFADPGEFRKSQNYIGGTKPSDAHFVPPPPHEMNQSLNDFEKFLHEEKMMPLIHIGLMHAQFETIHPFLDGNGRAGRLLITFLFWQRKLLEQPLFFLSPWFQKHQQTYYQKLDDYHNGKVENWINFFLDGVIETSKETVEISKKIRKLRDEDMKKLQTLAKRESESGVKVLEQLFQQPIVTTTIIMEWTGFTRSGAKRVIDRFISLDILNSISKQESNGSVKDATEKTKRAEDAGKTEGSKNSYTYTKYLKLFS